MFESIEAAFAANPALAAPGSKTALCGIVLHPAGHTRSPAMHRAAFAALGLDAEYHAFDIVPEELPRAIEQARSYRVRQLAVSIPHKETVIPLLDAVDETAGRIGAVNTVTRQDERLVGSNTDWIGAVRALERAGPIDGRRAIVLGAGGAARAVVYGLIERGARVFVLNRSVDRAEALVEALGGTAHPLDEVAALAPELIINTTSVGLREDVSPIPASAIPAGAIVMDAVYDPPQTRLLRDAADRGARGVEGKWMLVYQAAAQLETWTGRSAPEAVMADAFDQAGGTD